MLVGPFGPFVFGMPRSDEFSQGIYSCLCAEKSCELVVWGPFVPVFLVGLAFEYYVFARLKFCPTWASSRLSYGLCVVVVVTRVFVTISVTVQLSLGMQTKPIVLPRHVKMT